MTRRRSPLVPLLVLGAVFGCDSILGITPSDPDDGDAPARGGSGDSGGNAGSAGSAQGAQAGASGAAGETPGGSGGESGNDATGGGEPNGGGGGTSGGGSSGADSGAGGNGGSGGAAGGGRGGAASGEFPRAGEPCSLPGAVACTGAAKVGRVECRDGVWRAFDQCLPVNDHAQRCDRRDGSCRTAICESPGEPMPNGCIDVISRIALCGPDTVSTSYEACPLGCDDADACRGPGEGQLVIDKPRHVEVWENAWPTRLVPVCWRSATRDEALETAVRVAVESLWSRLTPLGFTGWGECNPNQARVELDVAENCRGELARVPFVGYPGAGAAFPVTICKSYYDHANALHPVIEPEILEFVARHVFAHVAGFEDATHDDDWPYFLDPVFDLQTFRSIELYWEMIDDLDAWYGIAPGRSLVAPDGRCLAFDGDTLSASACDGSDAQAFEPRDAALVHVASGRCVRSGASSGTIELAPCTADELSEAWLPERVRIRDHYGYCWEAGTSPTPGDSALGTAYCDPNWPERQSFRFEFVGPGRVRIHTTNARCIVAPELWSRHSVPSFGSCTSDRGIFDAFDGTLGVEGHCLAPDLANIVFAPCSAAPAQQYRISGPFELGGDALTLDGSTPLALSSTGLGPIPETSQIFDYRF